MSQEQRDSYVIPPNFIEGGSFFGGLFKARNVVEAVILAAGTGLPILTLSLTLTVRIILLCLTSLPLALLALIGIAGMPLSSYIILFFRFLRNRRSLSKSGGKSSRKQSILPTWDKKSGPSTAVQPAAYKKDGSRIRFAKDTRRLMLDTAYRQKKQAERPGNPLAAYVPIQKIENGIVYTTDHRFIKILEIVPINFLLRSAREQRNIVYSFISYLKIAPVKLQIKVITKRADMNRHIETVRREMAQETNESCRMQQEDYLKLLKKLGSREAIARRFFLIMEYEPLPGAKKDREEADAISSLQTAARTAANYLRQCGNSVVQHENEDEAAAEMLYTFLCRRESTDIPFLQRISHITSNYIKSGCSIDEIPVGDFFAPSQLDFTHGSYLCIDGTYYAYLLVPSDGYKSEVPAGWLSLLVNAGDGIDLDVFLTRQPKDRMIRKLGQQLRINRSKIKETSDTNTDFDDLDSAIRSGYFLKDGLSNHEDFYYLNLLITVTADNPDDLDWKCAEMKKLLISQDMNVQNCNFCQEQALRSSFPLVKLDIIKLHARRIAADILIFQMCLWEQKRCHLIGVYVQFTPVSIAFIRKKVKKRSHPTGQIRDQIILPNVQAIHNKLAQTRGRKHLPIFCFFFCFAVCRIAVIIAALQPMQAASSGIRLKHVGFGYVICCAGIIIDQIQQLFIDLLARGLWNRFCW